MCLERCLECATLRCLPVCPIHCVACLRSLAKKHLRGACTVHGFRVKRCKKIEKHIVFVFSEFCSFRQTLRENTYAQGARACRLCLRSLFCSVTTYS